VNGQHKKKPEATKRAEKRRQKARCAKTKKGSISDIMVITKPTLDEELKLFKAIVRHVTRHEVKNGKGEMYRVDNRASLRRLNDLGVSGHQPAIMAFCQMTKREKTKITEAILKQKAANNKKAEKLYDEFQQRQTRSEESVQTAETFKEQGDRILFRIARVATGTAVRWKREIKANSDCQMQTGKIEGIKGEEVKYHSRLLACTRCGSEQETKENS
jgi:hypothetical protein